LYHTVSGIITPIGGRPVHRLRGSPDDGQTNCPKHVEFYSKTNFIN